MSALLYLATVAMLIAIPHRGRSGSGSAGLTSATSGVGHERRFRDVRDESGLPPTPERLRQRSEPTLRAKCGPSHAR
jgi:hypothetical protein